MTPGDDDSEDTDGRVLAPEEIDITDDEHVAEIDDGRYVVSPNDPIDDVTSVNPDNSEPAPTEQSDSKPGSNDRPDPSAGKRDQPETDPIAAASRERTGDVDLSSLSERDVSRWLERDFEAADSRYGFHVTATFDGRVFQRRMMSNDVVTIFESLILWYAQHIDSDTPVEEILGILLTEANVPITYPPETLTRVVKNTDLGPEDTIGDLLEQIDDGFEL